MLTINELNAINEAICHVRKFVHSEHHTEWFRFHGQKFFITWESKRLSFSVYDGNDNEKIFTITAEFINNDTLAQIFANYLEYYINSGKDLHDLLHRKTSTPIGYTQYHYIDPSNYQTTTNYISLEDRVKKLEEKVVKSEKFFDTLKDVEKAMDDIWAIIDKWEDMDRNPYMASSGMDAIKEILDNLEG